MSNNEVSKYSYHHAQYDEQKLASDFGIKREQGKELLETCTQIFRANPQNFSLVTGGRGTSKILKFKADKQEYVCRSTDSSRPAFFIDTSSEIKNMKIASSLGVTPKLHHAGETGILIMDSITNTTPSVQTSGSDVQKQELYTQLAKNLRVLHTRATFPGKITDIFQDVLEAAEAGGYSRMPQEALRATQAIIEMAQVLSLHQRRAACHKEVTANNALFDGKNVYIIDWESSANCDPVADLAIAINFFIFKKDHEESFLESYFSGAITPEQKAHVFLMKQAIHCLYAFKYFRRVARAEPSTEHLDFKSLQNYKDFILEYFTGCDKVCSTKEFNIFAHIFLREAIKNIESTEYKEAIQTLQIDPASRKKLARAFEKITYLYRGVSQGTRPLIPYYLPEFVDRQHRRGRLMEPFFDAWKQSPATDDYDTWLHKLDLGQDVPGKDTLRQKNLLGSDDKPIPISGIRYLTDKERKTYEMHVNEDGKVFTEQNGGLFHSVDRTKEKSFIFVISQDSRVYIGAYSRGTFGHPSFLAARAVLAAGFFIFEQGKLQAIYDDSGHYNDSMGRLTEQLTTKQSMADTLQILKSKGVDLSNVEVTFVGKKETVQANDLLT